MNKAPLTSKGGPGSPLNSSLEEEERQVYEGLNESSLIVYTRELSIHDGWRQRGPPIKIGQVRVYLLICLFFY